jgi:hypothetical protein
MKNNIFGGFKMKSKVILLILAVTFVLASGNSCEVEQTGTQAESARTREIANNLQDRQPTPTDIEYSIERHNLIRRAYWVNGMRDKARAMPSPIADMPLGYVILFTDNGAVVGRFVVEGKVTSLNSFLAPHSQYYERGMGDSQRMTNEWLADVDGAYGENDSGIFFFTPDGRYLEWNGTYLYSDIPFIIDDPIVRIGE